MPEGLVEHLLAVLEKQRWQLACVDAGPPCAALLIDLDGVLDLIGPLYCRGEGGNLVLGLRVEHCNARGTIHGGILATLADVALGYTMAFASRPPVGLVTASLTLDFAGTAKIGDWLEAHVDVLKQGSRLAFANCYITVAEQRIVRASAVFLVTGQLDASASV